MSKAISSNASVNVSSMERVQSVTSGLLLLASGVNGIKKHPVASVGKSLVGAYLIYRGASGHCHVNQLLGRNTAKNN